MTNDVFFPPPPLFFADVGRNDETSNERITNNEHQAYEHGGGTQVSQETGRETREG